MERTSWLQRYSILFFFLLAYLLVWLEALLPNPVFAILGVASPTLAAVITLLLLKEKESTHLLKPLFQWRAAAVWYAVAILGPILLAAAAVVIIYSLGDVSRDSLSSLPWMALPAIFIGRLLVNVWEEIGWRGFALPRLQARSNGLTASLIIGFFWGLWHLPMYVGDGGDQTQLPFLLLLLDTTFISILYTWLYNNTSGSLLFVTLFHAIGNSVDVFAIEAGVPIVSYFVARLLIILIVDVIVIARYGKQLSQEESHESKEATL